MSKYVQAAQKAVQMAGYGGGIKVIEKYSKILKELSSQAREEGDEESATRIESLSEALITASL